MGFDEARIIEAFLEGGEGGVESFDVTHLECEASQLSGLDELSCFCGVFGDGFFDEHVAAFFEQSHADGKMGGCRGCDGGGIDERDKLLEGCGCLHFILAGHGFRSVAVAVVDGGELRSGNFREDAGVISADVTDSDDADTTGWVHSPQRVIRFSEARESVFSFSRRSV